MTFSTGDFKNSFSRCLRAMRATAIQYNDCIESIKDGHPIPCVTIMRRLLGSSRTAISQATARGILPGSPDRKVLIGTYDLLRELVHYNPSITIDQFLKRGMFAIHKVNIITALAEHMKQYAAAEDPNHIESMTLKRNKLVVSTMKSNVKIINHVQQTQRRQDSPQQTQLSRRSLNFDSEYINDNDNINFEQGERISFDDVQNQLMARDMPASMSSPFPDQSDGPSNESKSKSPLDGILIRRDDLISPTQIKAQNPIASVNAVNPYANVTLQTVGSGSEEQEQSDANANTNVYDDIVDKNLEHEVASSPLSTSPVSFSQIPLPLTSGEKLTDTDSYSRLYQRRQMEMWDQDQRHRYALNINAQNLQTQTSSHTHSAPESSPENSLQSMYNYSQTQSQNEVEVEVEVQAIGSISEKYMYPSSAENTTSKSVFMENVQHQTPIYANNNTVESNSNSQVGFADTLLSRLETRLMDRLGGHCDDMVQKAVAKYQQDQRVMIYSLATDVDKCVLSLEERISKLEKRILHDEEIKNREKNKWDHVLSPSSWSGAAKL